MSRSFIRQKISRDLVIADGVIANDINVANGNVAYTYFELGSVGCRFLTVQHLVVATTLTVEATNQIIQSDQSINGTATGAGSTTTIIDSVLNTGWGYTTDKDLVGALVLITADSVAGNIGQYRLITDYTGATGTMTFANALSGASSTNTSYQILDTPLASGNRLALDPPTTQWKDVTTILTGAATHTTSGIWFIDTNIIPARLRIKRVTTNATNSCKILLTRGR